MFVNYRIKCIKANVYNLCFQRAPKEYRNVNNYLWNNSRLSLLIVLKDFQESFGESSYLDRNKLLNQINIFHCIFCTWIVFENLIKNADKCKVLFSKYINLWFWALNELVLLTKKHIKCYKYLKICTISTFSNLNFLNLHVSKLSATF